MDQKRENESKLTIIVGLRKLSTCKMWQPGVKGKSYVSYPG